MKKIKGIIFDLDGVLIEAKDWHYEALNSALNLFGMEISRYDHLITYDGLPTKKKLEMLTLERGLPRALHKFVYDVKQKYTMEYVHTKCRPTFYHEYALSRLKHLGYKLAVASNAIRDSVRTMLEKANIIEYFDFYLSNEDVVKCKPDPEIYNNAISMLKLTPYECLILEDNEKGIKAALDSGAHLLKINSIEDVNLQNIMGRIDDIDGGHSNA